MPENYIESSSSDQVKISKEVIGSIANLAATNIEGIESMSGSITREVAEKFGMKNQAKGTKVETDEETCSVELSVIVEYGVNIIEVCKQVQQEVKKSIETMTGLAVESIDVVVAGIHMPKTEKSH